MRYAGRYKAVICRQGTGSLGRRVTKCDPVPCLVICTVPIRVNKTEYEVVAMKLKASYENCTCQNQ